MAEQRANGSIARRGVLAGVAAAVAAALAKWTAAPVAAGTDGDLVLGRNNELTAGPGGNNQTTVLEVTPGQPFGNLFGVLEVTGRGDTIGGVNGIYGFGGNAGTSYGGGAGVVGLGGAGNATNGAGGTGLHGAGGTGGGTAAGGIGVQGFGGFPGGTSTPSGIGVRGNSGISLSSPGTMGVLGISDANSFLLAAPTQAAGVYGLTNGSAVGVLGQANTGVGCWGSSNGNVGVLGTSSASHGLYGSSTNGYGVYATSVNSTGVVASTNGGNAIQGASNGNVGVLGTSQSSIGGFFSSASSTGLYASGPAAGYAARFDGPVLVNGNFTAIGGSKSAAVPHPDGSHRRLYCVESPESWFEDFGRGQLANGQARVRLDADFDALVRGDNYQVFLTPEGDCKGLYVSAYTPHTFEVRELQGGTSNLAFSYRVVAKRKDIAGPRLERVDIPAAPQRPPAPAAPPAITPLDPPRIDPNAQTGQRKSQ